AIAGLNRAFLHSISFIGADVLYVQKAGWEEHTDAEWHKIQKRRELTVEDAAILERDLTLARAVTPVSFTGRLVKYNKRNAGGVIIVGSTEQLLMTGGISVGDGRFLSPMETAGGRPVCV